MIYRALDVTPAEALNGTTALNWEALRQGATILRVHDVKEAVEVVQLFEKLPNKGNKKACQ
jgi:dihydropteroate synthase